MSKTTAQAASTSTEDFAAAHSAWHAEVEKRRTDPHGPLSITGLLWLTKQPQSFDGIPGEWSAESSTGIATALLPEHSGLSRNGQPLSGTVEFEPLTGIETLVLDWGEKKLELAARSGEIALRPRDPESADLRNYSGTAVFAPNEKWAVSARFTPAEREAVQVDTAAGETAKQYYDSPGTAEFEIDGRTFSLTLFGEVDGSPLRALYADESGIDLTYPAARFVGVKRVDDETVEIDFNRTTNLPCAYSVHATCPFPPPENRLPIRVEAGELRPGVTPPTAI